MSDIHSNTPSHSPKPDWLKIAPPSGERYSNIKGLVQTHHLSTVCQEAKCPNLSECWGGGTATYMLLGSTCTRGCRFCNIKTSKYGDAVDSHEPQKLAQTIKTMGIEYAVITMVDRDDLEDGGAQHIQDCLNEVKRQNPETLIEMLSGDFRGNTEHIATVASSQMEVYAHNIETTRALTPTVRDPRAGYDQSLHVLKWIKSEFPHLYTKSSIMVGLGETKEDVYQTMADLRDHDVDILTLGQYLQPSQKHLKVQEFVHPDTFKEYELKGKEMGFMYVASGPLVRSSYRAGELFLRGKISERKSLFNNK